MGKLLFEDKLVTLMNMYFGGYEFGLGMERTKKDASDFPINTCMSLANQDMTLYVF